MKLFNQFETIYTQSEYDKNEFEALGIEKKKVQVLGDIKAYNVLEKQKKFPSNELLNTSPSIPSSLSSYRLLVGSLHPGELDIYLNLYQAIKPNYPNLTLTIAPRHFHWKAELINKVKKTNYSFAVWDNENNPSNKNSCDILLVCKLGELFKLYQQATIYFLGGTFVPIGGHNLLEPAVWGKPSIIGPHHHNCLVIAKQLLHHNGLFAVSNETELVTVVQDLLNNPQKIKLMGTNSRLWLEAEAKRVERNLDSVNISKI